MDSQRDYVGRDGHKPSQFSFNHYFLKLKKSLALLTRVTFMSHGGRATENRRKGKRAFRTLGMPTANRDQQQQREQNM